MKLLQQLLLLFCLSLSLSVQAQLGETFVGKASYYADRFHGRNTSSGEPYDREEYTAAHRNLPFNTIVELRNTRTQKIAVVKINDRGPFSRNRMIDVSFAAARDLELLASGEAEVEMRVLELNNPENPQPLTLADLNIGFKTEFRQHSPVKFVMRDGRMFLDTTGTAETEVVIPKKLIESSIADSFVKADSLRKEHEEGDRLGFHQHKYIRVIKDGDGHYRLDTSIATPPTPQEYYTVASQTPKATVNKPSTVTATSPSKEVKEATQPYQIIEDTETSPSLSSVASQESSSSNPVASSGFRQHSYVKVYMDSEGRVRIDTTQQSLALADAGRSASNTRTSNANVRKPEPVKSTVVTNKPASASNPATPTGTTNLTTNQGTVIETPQHSYLQVYRDKDGRIKVIDSSQNPINNSGK